MIVLFHAKKYGIYLRMYTITIEDLYPVTNARDQNTNIEYMHTRVCADVVELWVPTEYDLPKLPTLSYLVFVH